MCLHQSMPQRVALMEAPLGVCHFLRADLLPAQSTVMNCRAKEQIKKRRILFLRRQRSFDISIYLLRRAERVDCAFELQTSCVNVFISNRFLTQNSNYLKKIDTKFKGPIVKFKIGFFGRFKMENDLKDVYIRGQRP